MGFDVGRPIIWDAYTGEKLLIFEGHQQGGGIVSWSPDGNRIASTGFDGKVMVWDAETGEVLLDLLPEGYSNWGAGVKWSNEGSRIAAFDGDGFGHIFNAQTGEELAKLCCHDSAWKITWSPTDERILTVGADGTGRVWDVESGAGLIVYDIGGFPSGGYSPDGTKVLLATGDGTTRIFPTWHDPQELIDYAKECCIVRELTPEEREQFGLPEKE
jgi:WD40 repeat protein